MEQYLILARSVTFAQRMQRAMEKAGVRSRMFRAPRDLTERGCAYVLKINAADLTPALIAIRRASLDPVQIFSYQQGFYQEVGV